MIEIIGNRNKDCNLECFNFKGLMKEYRKVLKICSKCKYFDEKTDFPNSFCDKSCEMIDYWFCLPKCPDGKFIIKEKED